MKYRVETTPRFEKEFRKLDRYTQRMLKAWIDKNLLDCADPRAHGKGLTANRSGQWRYRIGDYRLLCLIEDEELVILALTVGHRREVDQNLIQQNGVPPRRDAVSHVRTYSRFPVRVMTAETTASGAVSQRRMRGRGRRSLRRLLRPSQLPRRRSRPLRR